MPRTPKSTLVRKFSVLTRLPFPLPVSLDRIAAAGWIWLSMSALARRLCISTRVLISSCSTEEGPMDQVKDKPETIHFYVVREGAARPSYAPIVLSLFTLSLLIVLG